MIHNPRTLQGMKGALSELFSPNSSANLVKIFLLVFGINLTSFLLLFFLLPNYRDLIIRENSLVESLTALLYLNITVVSIFLMGKIGRPIRELLFFSVIGLLGFLDEISFGDALFNFSMPVFMGVEVDAIHDLTYFVLKFSKQAFLAYPGLFAFVAGGLIALAIFWWSKKGSSVTRYCSVYTFFFLAAFLGLVGASTIIDLHILHEILYRAFGIEEELLYALEELFEMNSAVCLIFLCISIFIKFKRVVKTQNKVYSAQ